VAAWAVAGTVVAAGAGVGLWQHYKEDSNPIVQWWEERKGDGSAPIDNDEPSAFARTAEWWANRKGDSSAPKEDEKTPPNGADGSSTSGTKQEPTSGTKQEPNSGTKQEPSTGQSTSTTPPTPPSPVPTGDQTDPSVAGSEAGGDGQGDEGNQEPTGGTAETEEEEEEEQGGGGRLWDLGVNIASGFLDRKTT